MKTEGNAAEGDHYPVFISFARPDGLDPALALRAELKSRGIRAFVDQEDGPVTSPYEPALAHALEHATVCVAVLTAQSSPKRPDCSGDQVSEIKRARRFQEARPAAYGIFVWLQQSAPALSDWPLGLDGFTGRDWAVSVVADKLVEDVARRTGSAGKNKKKRTGPARPASSPPPRMQVPTAEAPDSDGAATALEAVDPKAAVDEAVALLENLLLDASLAGIVRKAVGDAPGGLAAHLRRSKASAVVNALNGLHGRFIEQSLHKEARSVDRAVRLLLPFLGDWARLVSLARGSSGSAIELPIVDLTLAELLLAAADARPSHFTLRGAELRPTRLVLVTAARRAYRADPTTITRLLEQSLARRLSTANPYEMVEAVLRDTTLGDDFSELVRAVPDLPFTVSATPFRLDAETLSDLDARFTADRDNAVLEERCHWSLVIADENDLRCDELWRFVCTGLKGLEGLRLVRLSGGAAVDRKELKVSLQYLVKIMVRGHE